MSKRKTIGGILVTLSGNVKVGDASATYAPIKSTCPTSCPLRESGCYAQQDKVGFHLRKNVEPMFDGLDGDTMAVLEADAIRDGAKHVPNGRPLRLHVAGDATTDKRAATLADAAQYWPGRVWSYTHAWRDVARASWGIVSILASCESIADARAALAKGYAPAVIVAEHPADGRARVVDGVKVIPCPSQTRDVTCVECRLCFDADKLQTMGAAIAFAAHGPAKKRVLSVIQPNANA